MAKTPPIVPTLWVALAGGLQTLQECQCKATYSQPKSIPPKLIGFTSVEGQTFNQSVRTRLSSKRQHRPHIIGSVLAYLPRPKQTPATRKSPEGCAMSAMSRARRDNIPNVLLLHRIIADDGPKDFRARDRHCCGLTGPADRVQLDRLRTGSTIFTKTIGFARRCCTVE